MIIAIDGHASTGKSTVAKALARKLGLTYIDTGAMYRCATLFAIRQGFVKNGRIEEELLIAALEKMTIEFTYNIITGKSESILNGENVEKEIRSEEVANYVSPVSTIKEVRAKLVDLQQKMGEKGNIVLDGRDIGTVVFPNADFKFFMTANADVRAQRRYNEAFNQGRIVDFDTIKKNVEERDFIDSNRKESPLKCASDAIILDNSIMNHEEQLAWILDKITRKNNV